MTLQHNRILIIEDEILLSELLEELIKSLQAEQWDVCNDIDSAIDKLKHNTYDLMILDLMMPGDKDGFDMIEYLYNQKIPMPVLVHSAYIKDYKSRIRKYTTSSFLTIRFLPKPANFPALAEGINDLLERHRCVHVVEVEIPSMNQRIESQQAQIEKLILENSRIPELEKSLKDAITLLQAYKAELDELKKETFLGVIRSISIESLKDHKNQILGLTATISGLICAYVLAKIKGLF